MNLSDWQALSGAYQPDRMVRLEITFHNLPLESEMPDWVEDVIMWMAYGR